MRLLLITIAVCTFQTFPVFANENLQKLIEQSKPINPDYANQFDRCDNDSKFRNISLPWYNSKGKKVYYKCKSDKNRVELFGYIGGTGRITKTVIFTAKLGVDLDGSWFACNTPGYTDLCGTSLSFADPKKTDCPGRNFGKKPARCGVDSDQIDYVVIPVRGPTKKLGREFRDITEIKMGDVGFAFYKGKKVPIIVADGGPFNKLGEGSIALHRSFGKELCKKRNNGICIDIKRPLSSIRSGITYVIFPGSRPKGLNLKNMKNLTVSTAEALWEKLVSRPK